MRSNNAYVHVTVDRDAFRCECLRALPAKGAGEYTGHGGVYTTSPVEMLSQLAYTGAMAANQRNSDLFTYVDDNGTTWNKRGPIDTAINAIDGSAALTAGAPVWTDSKSRQCRKAVFFDPTTFRTVRIPVYTAAAFAAITGATTLDVNVPGEVAAVTYSLSEKIAEKQRTAKTSRNLPDHA